MVAPSGAGWALHACGFRRSRWRSRAVRRCFVASALWAQRRRLPGVDRHRGATFRDFPGRAARFLLYASLRVVSLRHGHLFPVSFPVSGLEVGDGPEDESASTEAVQLSVRMPPATHSGRWRDYQRALGDCQAQTEPALWDGWLSMALRRASIGEPIHSRELKRPIIKHGDCPADHSGRGFERTRVSAQEALVAAPGAKSRPKDPRQPGRALHRRAL